MGGRPGVGAVVADADWRAVLRRTIRRYAEDYCRARPTQWDALFARADEHLARWEDDGGGPR